MFHYFPFTVLGAKHCNIVTMAANVVSLFSQKGLATVFHCYFTTLCLFI